MWSRIGRVTHILLTLSAVGCCAWLLWREYHRPDPDRLSTHADGPLRNFLDVKWLGGDSELPSGEEHCAVVVLEFEDGKFRRRHGGTVFSPEPGGSRVIPFYIMWGRGPEGTRVVSGWPGMWGASNKDEFFAKLDGESGHTFGTSSLGEIRGYRVIGYACSSQTRPHQDRRYRDIVSEFELSLERHQSVVVLGVKPFATADEAKHWVYNHEERADP